MCKPLLQVLQLVAHIKSPEPTGTAGPRGNRSRCAYLCRTDDSVDDDPAMNEQPDSTRNPVKNPVKDVRQALGLSQDQMAAKLRCCHSTVCRWELKGTLPTRGDILLKLRWLAEKAGIEIEEAGK
jgi:DNA-binding transcriptional regulator YiaG